MTNVALTDQPERRTDAMGVGVGRRSRLDLIARMNVAGRTRGQDVDIWGVLGRQGRDPPTLAHLGGDEDLAGDAGADGLPAPMLRLVGRSRWVLRIDRASPGIEAD